MKLLFILTFLIGTQAFAELPQNYQSWTGREKQSYLIKDKILPTEYNNLPSYTKGGFSALLGSAALFTLDRSFNHSSDEMPEGRLKIIHTYGSVAAVDFIASSKTPYTGLFKGSFGLVRLGWAAPPLLAGHTPGMAIKLFISGEPSANMHIMHSLDGQGSNTNFFEKTFTNIIPQPEGFILRGLEKIFTRFVTNARHLTLDHVALFNSDGQKVEEPYAPHQIYFVAREAVQLDRNSDVDLRIALEDFVPGTTLYDVYAREEGQEEISKIGEIELGTRFISSKWGDENLFFQHSDTFLRERYKNP